MDLWTILGDIVLLLAACLFLGGLCSRIGQSPLVGYLIVGMLLGGPGSIHAVRSQQEIEAIAELGVALLLFSLGLEFSVERLKRLGPKPLLGGVAQVVLTLIIGAAGAFLVGLSLGQSVAFGAMISLSSTAVVLRILMERGELEMPHGRNSLAVLLTQDMAVVPLAVLMTMLGGEANPATIAWNVARLGMMAGGLIFVLSVLNRIAVRALGTLTLQRNRELTILFAVVTGLGSAWAAHAVGISPALGAFVAGMLLGSSAFATQIRADVSSLRVVLLTLFFGAAGMVADPIWIVKNWHIVAAVTSLLTVGKLLVIWVIFQLLGQPNRVAAATGLCLAQVGEFAFVLGSIGRSNDVIPTGLYALVVSITIVSFFLSAFLVPIAPRFGHWMARLLRSRPIVAESTPLVSKSPHLVIIGFGPAGQIAGSALVGQLKNVAVIDLNHLGVELAKQMGFLGQIGDATLPDVLDHVNLNQTQAIVITVPDHQSAMTILELVRHRAPQAYLVVRSRYQMHSASFRAAGAHAVVGDEEEVGEKLAEQLKQWLAESADGKTSSSDT